LLEREVKLLFRTPEDARAAIVNAGATPLRSRRLQDDALFDSEDGRLRKLGCTLRVRTERDTERPELQRVLLTVKGPVQPGTMKVREEHETAVSDGEALARVFDTLGLRVWFRYQKYREEFAAAGVIIAVDATPVGTFVEIEGDEQAILSMARAVGRTPADFILDSYYGLFLKRRGQFGLPGSDMLFAVPE
jgi:adenylate cyclase, class 2